MHTLLVSVFVILKFDGVSTGTCLASVCDWEPWNPWSGCSKSCGGCSRSRNRSICCKGNLVSDVNACLLDCNKDNSGFDDNELCNQWCYNGGTIHSSGQSCICQDAFYGYCCQNVCTNITQCRTRSCTSATNAVCHECVENNVMFKTWNDSKECQRMCAWNNHTCWPGTCDTSKLTKDCVCAKGFVKRSIVDYSSVNAGETTCQPNTTPVILVCDTVAIGPNGERKQAKGTAATTSCEFLADMYGNYKPITFVFNMTTEFTVDITELKHLRPSYIKEEQLGVTDTAINVMKQTVEGKYQDKTNIKLLVDIAASLNVQSVHNDSGKINVNEPSYDLQNGDALCLEFEAKGGGYLKSIDTRSSANTPSGPVPYTKVTQKRILCYRYDDVPPVHCSDLGSCVYELLHIANRVTRSSIVTANVIGWIDPISSEGHNTTASAIESYEITVYGVYLSNQSLKIDPAVRFYHKTLSANVTNITFDIPSNMPTLYSVYLSVHDRAGNARMARRFVLYDNTSYIEKSNDSLMYFKTGYRETGFKWQNDSYICLTWRNYFVNEMHMQNKFLNAIELDPRFNITGVYEQTTGLLPVSGTPNVKGIVRFFVSQSVGGGEFTPQLLVQNFAQQQFCDRANLTDGKETIWKIQAVDIAGNTLSDERSLIFDASPPSVLNVQLRYNQYDVEYIQRFSDLRKLALNVTARDEHSGVYAIDVGVTNGASYRSIVPWISNEVQCSATPNCYCVQPEQCQMSFHVLQLDDIDGVGHLPIQMRVDKCSDQCELQVTVVNLAGSSTVQIHRLKIDKTEPETRSAKIDIIMEASSLNSSAARLEWSGFKDQESGIRFYRVYVSEHCLTTNDTMQDSNTTSYAEMNVSTMAVSRDFAGTRYVTDVAFNGALTSSQSVCSEGIKGVEPLQSNADRNNTALTVGTSFGVILAIALICLAIFLLVRKNRPKIRESSVDHSIHPTPDISNEGVTNVTYGEVLGNVH